MTEKKSHYHFLTIARNGGGFSFVTLPGQHFSVRGQLRPVRAGLLVKADKGAAALFRRLKSASDEGDCFATTTLRRTGGCYACGDLLPVKEIPSTPSPSTDELYLAWKSYLETDTVLSDGKGAAFHG